MSDIKQAIMICTYPRTPNRSFLVNCLESLQAYEKVPVIVLDQYPWEVGHIKWMYEHTDFDEFFFLQETMEIKKPHEFFDLVFETHKGKSVFLNPPSSWYIGKYRREILTNIQWPIVETKLKAVEEEVFFTNQYKKLDPGRVFLWDQLVDPGVYEWKFGRMNRIIENDYIKKYQGTWGPEMIT